MTSAIVTKKLLNGPKWYFIPKKTALDIGINKYLPEEYKKFYREWILTYKQPVHYIPQEGKYGVHSSGEVQHVTNEKLKVVHVPQMHRGIWGGEFIIQGFKHKVRRRRTTRAPYFWIPKLLNGVVYSEVLNKHMRTVVTPRTIRLINQNYGFDYYLLNTKACDLVSSLALRLKRKILLTLYNKSMYPEDEKKREEVYNRYKHYLDNYTEKEIDWYGLTLKEAAIRYKVEREEGKEKKLPLKYQYRQEFIERLKDMKDIDPSESEPSWWRKKLFPY